VAALAAAAPMHGQQGAKPATLAVNASGSAVATWAARVETMLHDGTLEVSSVQADTMVPGRTHERLDQMHEGLPVFGGQLVRQRNGAAVTSVSGRIFENVSVPTVKPSIDAARAKAIAEQHLGQNAAGDEPVLGILAGANAYVTVYRLRVKGQWDVRRYDVNAVTGAVEDSQSEFRHQSGVVGKGTGVLGDAKKVVASPRSGGFQTIDNFRPATAFTYALDGTIGRFIAFNNTLALFDSDLGFSSANQWQDGALVDAHAYSGWTYDYFFKTFGRRGLDDANFPVTTVVHGLARSLAFTVSSQIRGLFINNAFYLHPGMVYFGDGDGALFDYLAASLDVVAHELTHGVTGFSSRLEYRDEPGALNEAFSDIMGAGAEFFQIKPGQGPQKGPNWILGEDVTFIFPGFIRSMENPAAAGDPDHYSLRMFIGTPIDGGGVHINSGIINHAFFLAVQGGTNRVSGIAVPGIGRANIERMLRIFYRAFVFFLGPFSQFSDARAATLQAATELYGPNSNERAQLQLAWTAVGVN
jgi:Zn-dependent metalloprotease